MGRGDDSKRTADGARSAHNEDAVTAVPGERGWWFGGVGGRGAERWVR